MNKKIIVAAGILLVLIGAGVVAWKMSAKPSISGTDTTQVDATLFSATVDPLTVQASSDVERRTTKTLNASGGEVALENTQVAAQLIVPEQAISGEQELTIVPLITLTGLPEGATLLTGVQAEPTGTQFLEAATLQFTVPQESLNGSQVIGFEYSGSGEDFHYVPVKRSGDTVSLLLSGFSGHGLIVLPEYAEPPFVPSQKSAQAKQIMSNILHANVVVNSTLDDATNQKLVNVLKTWYTISVKAELQAAIAKGDAFDHALHEYVDWISFIEFLGYTDELSAEMNAAKELLSQALATAVTQADQQCDQNKDIAATARLVWLSNVAGVFDIGDSASIYDKAFECTNFTLVITSNLHDTAGPGANLSATIPLNFDTETSAVSGTAEASETNPTEGEFTCTSPAFTYSFTVEPTTIAVQKADKPTITLPLTVGVSDEFTYDCSTEEVGIQSAGAQFWAEAFDLAHESERTSYDFAHLYYTFTDWEIVNSGGVFARKVYNRSVGTVSEQTTLELRHTPK